MTTERSTGGGGDSRQQTLSELLRWLETQKGGVATFYEFQHRSLALRASNPGQAGLLRLLADLSGRFADLYDGEPLDQPTANEALGKLIGHVREAGRLHPAATGDLLDLANRIGNEELAPAG